MNSLSCRGVRRWFAALLILAGLGAAARAASAVTPTKSETVAFENPRLARVFPSIVRIEAIQKPPPQPPENPISLGGET